jgi:purine-nucleoside phosphorylase
MTPKNFITFVEKIDYCLIIFSHEICQHILDCYNCKAVFHLNDCTGEKTIYKFEYKGKIIAFFNTYVGSAGTGNLIEESFELFNCKHYIMFGSCGSLDKDKTNNKFIIPTKAYRDEGMSYHYMEPSDYVDIKNHKVIEKIFKDNNIPYVLGSVWTTDAFYRETIEEIDERKKAGDIAVEMELAGAQAVCNYLGIELYDFLASGDVLSEEEYNHDELHNANHSLDKLEIALKIVENI